MCLAVYLASDSPVRPIPWNPDAPALYVEPVAEGDVVRKQLSLPYHGRRGSQRLLLRASMLRANGTSA